jgi:hypothetical protein
MDGAGWVNILQCGMAENWWVEMLEGDYLTVFSMAGISSEYKEASSS